MRSVLSVLLCLLLAASVATAQETKTVYDPVLAGGEVLVQGLFRVRYVGDWREPAPKPETLETSWTTLAPSGKPREVLVLEERAPGQDERSWKREHRRLVAKVAASFPPVEPPRSRLLLPRLGRRR